MLSRAKGEKIYGGQKKLPTRARELAMAPRRGAGEGARARGCEPCAHAPGLGAGGRRVPRGARARTARSLLPAPVRTFRPSRGARPTFRQRARAWGVHEREEPGGMRRSRMGAGKGGTRPRPPGAGGTLGAFRTGSRQWHGRARGGAASGPGWAGGFGPAVAQAGGAGAGSGTSGGRPGAQARPQETAGRGAPCAAWHIPAVRLHPPPHIPGDKKSFAPAKVARVNIKKAALPEKRECPSRTRERPCSP